MTEEYQKKPEDKISAIESLKDLGDMFEKAKESKDAAVNFMAHLQNRTYVGIYQRKGWTLMEEIFVWLNEENIPHEKPTLRLSSLLGDDLIEVMQKAKEAGFQVEAEERYQPTVVCYTGHDMEIRQFVPYMKD